MSGKHLATEIVQTTDDPSVSDYVRVGWKIISTQYNENRLYSHNVSLVTFYAQNDGHTSFDGSWSTISSNASERRISRSTGRLNDSAQAFYELIGAAKIIHEIFIEISFLVAISKQKMIHVKILHTLTRIAIIS